MKTEELKELLQRYYRGETTLPEERTLKNFFLQDHLPEELKAERETFLFLSTLSNREADLPKGLEERLSRSIRRWEERDARQSRLKVRKPKARLTAWYTGIAAALLIAFGTGLYVLKATDQPRDTFDNPQLAYAEAERALQLFATTLNKGQSHVAKAENRTQRIKEQLEKCCNALADTPETINNNIKKRN